MQLDKNPEKNTEILEVYDFLMDLQPAYEKITSSMRQRLGRATNRGCGPDSFSIAKAIQQKFPELGIDASLDTEEKSEDGIHIIVGLAKETWKDLHPHEWMDHAWLEVVKGGRKIFVSPKSEFESTHATFDQEIIYGQDMEEFYEEKEYRRVSGKELMKLGEFDEEYKNQIEKIVTEINAGEVPEAYKDWYQEWTKEYSNS